MICDTAATDVITAVASSMHTKIDGASDGSRLNRIGNISTLALKIINIALY